MMLNKYKRQNPFTPIKFPPNLKRLSLWFKNQLQNPTIMWNLHPSLSSKKKLKRSCLQLVKSMVIKNKFWRNLWKILYKMNTIKKLNKKLSRYKNQFQVKMKLCRNSWKILYNKRMKKRFNKEPLRKSRLKKIKLCKNLWKTLFNKNKLKMSSNKYTPLSKSGSLHEWLPQNIWIKFLKKL